MMETGWSTPVDASRQQSIGVGWYRLVSTGVEMIRCTPKTFPNMHIFDFFDLRKHGIFKDSGTVP
jgi:hypothetical protein